MGRAGRAKRFGTGIVPPVAVVETASREDGHRPPTPLDGVVPKPSGAADTARPGDGCGPVPPEGYGPAPGLPDQAAQYCPCLPIERYMQSAFSRSWSTASRLRAVSRSMTSSGG